MVALPARGLRLSVAALLLLAQAPALDADVVRLLNGDRITGRVVGAITRRVRVQTPHGVLNIPRRDVDRIERDGGSVEILAVPAPAPTPAPTPPPPPPVRLQLAISGDTFWHAWDKKAAPDDTSLRLELLLDDALLVSYTDSTLDPEDLPKAIVNSFVFSPEELHVRASEGVIVTPPLVAESEVGLALEAPGWLAGPHRFRARYRLNEGTPENPHWRDAAGASLEATLAAGETLPLRLEQSRGAMEFAQRRMQGVSSFVVLLRREGETSPAP